MSSDIDKLLQQSLHTKNRKAGEESIDQKLIEMNKAMNTSDPFISYIIHHAGKYRHSNTSIEDQIKKQEIAI